MEYKRFAMLFVVLVAALSLVAVLRAQDDTTTPAPDDPLVLDEPIGDSSGGMQEPGPDTPIDSTGIEAPLAAEGSVVSAFVFNPTARLVLNGHIVNGNCDANFNLYNAKTGGTLIGGPVYKVITVEDGRFITALDFGGVMSGEERWVQMAVRCPAGSGSYTTINPRRYLTAVPYALGLRPGATIEGSTNGNALAVINSSTGYNDRGITAVTASNDSGYAVRGIASSTTGDSFGISGEARSPSGYAGLFINTAVGGEAIYARSGHQYTPDIILGANGSEDDGRIASEQSQPGSDIVLDSRDKVMVLVGMNRQKNSDSYFDVRHPDYGMLFRVYPDGRSVARVLQITGGSDLSEQFDIRPLGNRVQPEPGMVVCIDARNPGELVVCGQAYSKVVAGVISGAGGIQPGMMMGQDGTAADGQHPVALTGRVYVWADASQGTIQPGDLLTTSATPGHAMRVADSSRAQGAILGKAMTALEDGKGLVLVLVSLQ